MKTVVPFICSVFISLFVQAQDLSKRLATAVKNLEADGQLRNGMMSLYVVNQNTGAVVFAKNATIGLPVASSQKVITSAAVLELLGMNYRFKTQVTTMGEIENGLLKGNVEIVGSGDPTLGSWRYDNTKEQIVLNNWVGVIKGMGITKVQGVIKANTGNWESQTIPGGWIWDDIGNYYGAGVSALNWRENQYDLNLKSGNKTGDEVTIVSTVPKLFNVTFTNELKAGKPGSGDNGYIYLPPYSTHGFIRGTIPPAQNSFTISGSFPNPSFQLTSVFTDELEKQGIKIDSVKSEVLHALPGPRPVSFVTYQSPPLDSINYWFLKKSINLYGEAFVKTLGFEKKREGSTEAGLTVIKDFWKTKGIESTALNMIDGSGLSPQNRVTATALVKVMQFSRTRPWFPAFYNALPEINGIKMKSGTIGGTKSFTGYIKGYTFAIVTNNFNGSAAEMVRKMYRVLDVLK